MAGGPGTPGARRDGSHREPLMRANDNPFAVHRIHSLRFQFQDGETLESLSARFWAQVDLGKRRQVLLGHHGTGKSTLLSELGRCWKADGIALIWLNGAAPDWSSLRTGATFFFENSARSVVLIDSGERLSRWDWLRIWWRLGRVPILFTAHRGGKLPILYNCRSTFLGFEQLCRELLGERWSEFDHRCPTPMRREIFEQERGDIRQCFFELFDRMAQGTGPFGPTTRIM